MVVSKFYFMPPFFTNLQIQLPLVDTAISRKVVGKNAQATIPKGNMGYVQYTVPEIVAVEPVFFLAFL